MKPLSIKKVTIFFVLIIIFPAAIAQDQLPEKKHIIGFNGPVSINSNLINGGSVDCIFALRYGYRFSSNITAGAEFSGYYTIFLADNITDARSYGLRPGVFGRYTLFPDSRINLFAEAQIYTAYSRFIPGSDPVFDSIDERKSLGLSAYLAPGISLKSKSRKLSFDLMYKFADRSFKYGREYGVSWRLNFHF